MRRVYERPVMKIELFMANQAVSTCTVEHDIKWTFDCMFGTTTDTANVISTQIPGVEANCSTNIGYAGGVTTARDYGYGFGHSNNNPTLATWGYYNSNGTLLNNSNGAAYLQVSYTGAEGLLYTDGNATTDASVWSNQGTYVKHSSDKGGTHHMIAPVMDSTSINASW